MLLLILRLESLSIMLRLKSSLMIKWLNWQRPMGGHIKNTKHTSKLIQPLHLATITPLFKQILCPSLFRKRSPVASVGGATTTVNAQHRDRCTISIVKITTGHRCVEHRETLQLATHPPHTSNRANRRDYLATSTRKAPREVPTTRRLLPRSQEAATARPSKPVHWR